MAEDNSNDYNVKESLEAAKYIAKRTEDIYINEEKITIRAEEVRFLTSV